MKEARRVLLLVQEVATHHAAPTYVLMSRLRPAFLRLSACLGMLPQSKREGSKARTAVLYPLPKG